MISWSKDELRKIAEADDLHISPFRQGGLTYGTPTWIWCVAVNDALYVRGYNGQDSSWYQGRGAAEGRADHRRRYDEEGHVRAGRRTDQQPHRRCLPSEVPCEPIPQPNDRAPVRARRDKVKVMPREICARIREDRTAGSTSAQKQ